jgi:hypothetical protein
LTSFEVIHSDFIGFRGLPCFWPSAPIDQKVPAGGTCGASYDTPKQQLLG